MADFFYFSQSWVAVNRGRGSTDDTVFLRILRYSSADEPAYQRRPG
jgi:hypothetical protein